jgi:hypothetical protein
MTASIEVAEIMMLVHVIMLFCLIRIVGNLLLALAEGHADASAARQRRRDLPTPARLREMQEEEEKHRRVALENERLFAQRQQEYLCRVEEDDQRHLREENPGLYADYPWFRPEAIAALN